MKKLKINFTDEAGFKTVMEEQLKTVKGKVRNSGDVLDMVEKAMAGRATIVEDPEIDSIKVKVIINKNGKDVEEEVVVTPPKGLTVKRTADEIKAQLELAVDGLLYANAFGFTEKHQAAIQRIQAIAAMIEVRKRELAEQQAVNKERKFLLDLREKHEKAVYDKLVADRAETARLAKTLKDMQQELFRAQVALFGAHDYNLYLEQYLRDAERRHAAKDKKGKGK
jgi:hypothetical protein